MSTSNKDFISKIRLPFFYYFTGFNVHGIEVVDDGVGTRCTEVSVEHPDEGQRGEVQTS